MATFPILSSGAVTQYPALTISAQRVHVIRFLDGQDQRYLGQGRTFRSWQIRLDLLNEAELFQLEAFYEQQSGDYSPFTFPDPFSGAGVTNCRFASPSLVTAYTGVDCGAATVWVIETNG